MSEKMKIAGFGITCLDYICLTEKSDANGNARISEYKETLGGLTGNAVLAAKRLGANVSLMSVFGNDETKEKIFSMLNKEGINTNFCQTIDGRKSLFSFITIDSENGDRNIFSRKDNIKDSEIILDFSFMEGASALILDFHWKNTAIKVAEESQRRNIPVIGDVRIAKDNLELLKYLDYPIISIDYALDLTKDRKVETALKIMKEAGAGTPIITAGERGSFYMDKGRLVNVPAFKVVPVADTCGAGDVFHGAFAFAVLKYDLKEALRVASAVSAIKCTRFGGGSGTPDFDETMDFIKT